MGKGKLVALLDYHQSYNRKIAEYTAAKESTEMDIVAEIHNLQIDLPVRVGGLIVNVVGGSLEVTSK